MPAPKPLPPADELLAVLAYDQSTGAFTNRVRRNAAAPAGAIAGAVNRRAGYRVIRHGGELYLAHRLAWLCAHGADPGALEVDHINGDRSDNRIVNLRLATHQQNLFNAKRKRTNTSGRKGVRLVNGKWEARLRIDGKPVVLGSFPTEIEAAQRYAQEINRTRGEFARFA